MFQFDFGAAPEVTPPVRRAKALCVVPWPGWEGSMSPQGTSTPHEVFPGGPTLLLSSSSSSHGPETDRIPGTYEGGFKVWSCSCDLARFLIENPSVCAHKNVMEIGCGHAIPAMVSRGRNLLLQDFNTEVLTDAVIPNLQRNIISSRDADRPEGVVLVSCDWSQLVGFIHTPYDVVLGTDVTFTAAACRDVVAVLGACFKLQPKSVAYIATKKYYFGTGGGSQEFSAAMVEVGGMASETIWSAPDHSRCILKVTLIKT